MAKQTGSKETDDSIQDIGRMAELEKQLASNLTLTENGSQSAIACISDTEKSSENMSIVPYVEDDEFEDLYDSKSSLSHNFPTAVSKVYDSLLLTKERENEELKKVIESLEVRLRSGSAVYAENRTVETVTTVRMVQSGESQGSELALGQNNIPIEEVLNTARHQESVITSLRRELDLKSSEMKQLSERVECLHSENSFVNDNFTRLQQEHLNLSVNHEKAQNEIQRLANEYADDLAKHFETKREEMSKLQATIQQLNAQNACSVKRCNDSEKMTTRSKQEIATLLSQIQTLRQENVVMIENVKGISQEKLNLLKKMFQLETVCSQKLMICEGQIKKCQDLVTEKDCVIVENEKKWDVLRQNIFTTANKNCQNNKCLRCMELESIFRNFSKLSFAEFERELKNGNCLPGLGTNLCSINGPSTRSNVVNSLQRTDASQSSSDDDNDSVVEIFNSTDRPDSSQPSTQIKARSNSQQRNSNLIDRIISLSENSRWNKSRESRSKSRLRQRSPSSENGRRNKSRLRERNSSSENRHRSKSRFRGRTTSSSSENRHRSRSRFRKQSSSPEDQRRNRSRCSRGRSLIKSSSHYHRSKSIGERLPSRFSERPIDSSVGRDGRLRSRSCKRSSSSNWKYGNALSDIETCGNNNKRSRSRRRDGRFNEDVYPSYDSGFPSEKRNHRIGLNKNTITDSRSSGSNSSLSNISAAESRRQNVSNRLAPPPPFALNCSPEFQELYGIPTNGINWCTDGPSNSGSMAGISFGNRGLSTSSNVNANRISATVEGNGSIPLVLNVGNGSNEISPGNYIQKYTISVQKNVPGYHHGKHPLRELDEQCKLREWPEPVYRETSTVKGSKMHFFYDVKVNYSWYHPHKGSTCPRDAKLLAALYCLQQLQVPV